MTESKVQLSWPNRRAPSRSEPASLTLSKPGRDDAHLIAGDNLAALSALSSRMSGEVTLAYLDPPFLTGRKHERVTRGRDPETGEVTRTTTPAFDDRWTSLSEYLENLGPRVAALRDLLSAHGCLVLHVDSKTSHYAKVLCDEIFGPDCFASEIVWRYRRWPSRTPNFQRVHDVLLRYVKDSRVRPRFRQLYEPLAASTVSTWGTKRQRAVVGESGRRLRSSSTEEASPGTPLGDVWEIGIVAPVSRERTGYPTQKPEALLERLLSACSEEGDLVLDPYLGSGTTAAVAARLGRRFVGIDANVDAISIARERLVRLGVTPSESVVVPARVRAVRRVRQAAAETAA